MNKRVSVWPLLGLAVCVGALSCKRSSSQKDLVARVNGEGVTRAEFDRLVERNMARYEGAGTNLPADMRARISGNVLRRLVDDKAIDLKAAAIGVGVSEEELTKRFDEQKRRFGTDVAFRDYITRAKTSEAEMRAEIRRSLLRERLVAKLSGDVTVSRDEVAAYYQANLANLTEQEQVKVARILVRPQLTVKATDKERAAARRAAAKTAQDIRARVLKPDADFGLAAAEHSEGPEKNRRGEVGWLTRGRMPLEFDNVAFSLPVGKVSDVVETPQGYEVIKVLDKRAERQRALDQVEEGIRESLLARKQNEKQREVLRRLIEESRVETFVSFEPSRLAAAPSTRPLPGEPSKNQPRPTTP